MGDDTEKYTLVYYTPDDTDTVSPPFKYRTYYLADTLEGAWRNHQAGGNAVSIVQDQRIVFSNEELLAAFSRVSDCRAGRERNRQSIDFASRT